MANLQIGVIGCGGRGIRHLQCLASFDDVDVAAVCDPLAASLEQVGEEFGIAERFTSSEELLDGVELDAVVVAPRRS